MPRSSQISPGFGQAPIQAGTVIPLVLSLQGFPEEEAVGITPEEEAVGITPEEEAVGITPEEEAVGITPEEEAVGITPEEEAVGITPEEEGVPEEETQVQFPLIMSQISPGGQIPVQAGALALPTSLQ